MNKIKENLKNKINNKDGYISIEAIIVAGVAIAIGIVAFTQFKAKADSITGKALDKIDQVEASLDAA